MSILNLSLEMNNGVSKLMLEMVSKAVRYCGEVHNFDAELMLVTMNVNVSVSDMSVDKKSKKSLAVEKCVKSRIPLPFSGKAKENCCHGLRQNHGLYTQCETVVKDKRYCNKCGENPEYGTIDERLEAGLMEFRDPKGKSPTHFMKVMKKLKISREEVEEEAGKLNIIINDIHFEEEKVEKKEKGRPKKPKRRIELADDSTDLFAALVAKANEESDESGSSSEEDKSSIAENIIDSVLDKVSVIAENKEKEAIKQAEKQKKEAEKEALKQAEKAEKEALKQAEKAEKEALKQAEKAEKEAVKQAEIQKKEALKQSEIQKKAEKEAEKQKKEAEKAEKEALKLAEKQKKEEEKQKKESVQASKVVKSKKESVEPVEVEVSSEKKASKSAAVKEVEEPEEDIVKRFEFEGVKYLKSKKTGIIYNMEHDVIGKWNEKTGKIDFEEAGSEEEEEEYDE